MFNLYECGCIGFVTRGWSCLPGERKQVRCFKACDTDRDAHGDVDIFRRDSLQDKRWRKLTDEEVEALLDEVAEVVADGHRYRLLRSVLKTAVEG